MACSTFSLSLFPPSTIFGIADLCWKFGEVLGRLPYWRGWIPMERQMLHLHESSWRSSSLQNGWAQRRKGWFLSIQGFCDDRPSLAALNVRHTHSGYIGQFGQSRMQFTLDFYLSSRSSSFPYSAMLLLFLVLLLLLRGAPVQIELEQQKCIYDCVLVRGLRLLPLPPTLPTLKGIKCTAKWVTLK